jgi:hypothetical protein
MMSDCISQHGSVQTAVLAAATTAVLLTGASGQPNLNSATFLLPHCKAFVDSAPGKDNDVFLQGVCAGQLYAVFTHVWSVNLTCPPASETHPESRSVVTTRQMARVVITYIEQNPQLMHESLMELAVKAFVKAWPCTT